jgi:hypothetical protein
MTENGTGAADGDGLGLEPTDGEEEAVMPEMGDGVGDTVLREEGGRGGGREAPGRGGGTRESRGLTPARQQIRR